MSEKAARVKSCDFPIQELARWKKHDVKSFIFFSSYSQNRIKFLWKCYHFADCVYFHRFSWRRVKWFFCFDVWIIIKYIHFL